MNPEENSKSQMTNKIYLYKVPRVVNFVETERRILIAREYKIWKLV